MSEQTIQEGLYSIPVQLDTPFAYINFYNNDKPCLVVVNDGAAGCTYIVDDKKYTIGKHATGLIPHTGIDIKYLQKISEPIFRKRKKGREGELGKNEYTSLKPIAIKRMKDTIPIPIKEDGTYDIEIQRELADKYEQIEEIKKNISQKILELLEVVVI